MKYQLIDNNISSKNISTIEQILLNRGIANPTKYLTTTDEVINSYNLLGKEVIQQGIDLLFHYINHRCNTLLIVDCDVDGYTSAALLVNYLHNIDAEWVENYLHFYFHDGKQHGLKDCIEIAEQYDFIIVPDAGSNDYLECEQLYKKQIQVLILDHHIVDEDNSICACRINNQYSDYPNKNLSGVGIVWQFCRAIDEKYNYNYANDYIDLVALGLIADMMDIRELETKHLINKGLTINNIKNPFLYYMIEKNSYSIGKEITPIGIAFYVAPFVNATTRCGTQEEKILIFNSMLQHKAFDLISSTKRGHKPDEQEKLVEQAVRTTVNIKRRQTKLQDDAIALLEKQIEENNMLQHSVLLFILEDNEVLPEIRGLIANKFMGKYQKSCCVLSKVITEDGIFYQGSARGCEKTGVTNFREICQNFPKTEYAKGHPSAFGLSLAENSIEDFLQYTDNILQDSSNEAIYNVDFIFQRNNINDNIILDISNYGNLWGEKLSEPLIAIENIYVSKDMINIYRKNTNTLKIILSNSPCVLIKFNVTDEEIRVFEDIQGYLCINFVGRCTKNEWNGNITPELIIQDFEIISQRRYLF